MTLREIAKHEAMHEIFPILGTPDQVVDIIEQTASTPASRWAISGI